MNQPLRLTQAILVVVVVASGCAQSSTTPPGDDAQAPLPEAGAPPADAAADASSDVTPVEASTGSCTDGIKNGQETDVNCGGPDCKPCDDGKSCSIDTDCTAGLCTAGKCGPHSWLVESSGNNVSIPGDQTWVPAGLSATTTLYASSLVLMRWAGTLRFAGGGNGLCHVGQRFVVDGNPTGNATWGNAITVMRSATRWHESFSDMIAMPLAAGAHTISVDATNANGYGTCYLDGDGGLPYDRSRLEIAAYDPQSAWYAESTGETGARASGSGWTDIPGVTVSFTLGAADHVQMSMAGSELGQGSGEAHCAYRLVVDGTPLGDPNHGQAISVDDVGGGWWAPVGIDYGEDMASGAHTVKAQVATTAATGGTCNAGQGNQDYAKFRLFVDASPQGGLATSVESAGGADILGSTSQWVTIGGLSATFDVTTPRHLLLDFAATERTLSGSGHCAWRYVVDGTPLGDPNHGQAINVGDGATTWWTLTPLLWGQNFDAGSHTVSVQLRNSSTSGDCGTNGDGLAYGRARLLVRAP